MKWFRCICVIIVATGIVAFSVPSSADRIQRTGRVTFLRVHDVGTGWGPSSDKIDVEVVIRLSTSPSEAYGFQLRDDKNRVARKAMLDLLRDAFMSGFRVRIDYDIDPGKKNGVIMRVALEK